MSSSHPKYIMLYVNQATVNYLSFQIQHPGGFGFCLSDFLKKYGMLHEFASHPCTGTRLIFSVLAQF